MYAFCQDMPGLTLEQQDRLTPLIPAEALTGCVVHVVGEIEGGIADGRRLDRRGVLPHVPDDVPVAGPRPARRRDDGRRGAGDGARTVRDP